MTETTGAEAEQASPPERGLSSLQKSLFGVLAFFFVIHVVFWYLEFRIGVSHVVASTTLVAVVVSCFMTALALPWLPLPDQRDRTSGTTERDGHRLGLHRSDTAIHLGAAVALVLRPDQSRRPERRALDVHVVAHPSRGRCALFERRPAHHRSRVDRVLHRTLRNVRDRAVLSERQAVPSIQLSFIMGGIIVEVTLPAVYFGVEIANNLQSMTSPVEMWIKFVVLNLLWCTMPLVTYFWGVRRLVNQDLQ